MHMFGWTTWGWKEVTADDMRTWKHHSSRIFVSIPDDDNREKILLALSDAIDHIC